MRYAIVMGDVVFCCELDQMPQDLLNGLNEYDAHDVGQFVRTSRVWDYLEELAMEQWHCGEVTVTEDKPPLMEGKPIARWAQHVILWQWDRGFYYERCLSGDCGNCNCG